MGARSSPRQVLHPYPVVFDALAAALPANRFQVREQDRRRGRIVARTWWERVTIHLGAIDAVTTTWVADAELRLGIGPERHERAFERIDSALERYLDTYYRPTAAGPPQL